MISKDLVAASSKSLILSILCQRESYGYEIIQIIHDLSQNEMQWKDGMLYPVLHKMEKDNLIESFWKTAESGRRRKYYRIKSDGKKFLDAQKKQWISVNAILNQLWRPSPCLT